MFELRYNITDADMRAVNKKSIISYFALYFCVALCGLAAGVAAIVLKPSDLTFIAGIVLTVFGGLLLACALLMLIAPRNLLKSVVPTGDADMEVKIDHDAVTVDGKRLSYSDITSVKNKKTYLLVFFGRSEVLLVKNALADGTLGQLCEYISARAGRALPPSLAAKNAENAENTSSADGADASAE